MVLILTDLAVDDEDAEATGEASYPVVAEVPLLRQLHDFIERSGPQGIMHKVPHRRAPRLFNSSIRVLMYRRMGWLGAGPMVKLGAPPAPVLPPSVPPCAALRFANRFV